MRRKKVWTANQVAERLGISKQTLSRYEKKGVFPKASRNSINHWRQYTAEDLQRLMEIIRGKSE